MTTARPARGIRRTGSGWQVYVRVKGEFRSKHFPPNTDLVDLKRWRDSMKARGWLDQPEPEHPGHTFGHDCQTYLEIVAGMTTYTDRAYRIGLWKEALGAHRARSTITAAEIRHQLERWRLAGKSPATMNLRRTALMHLYTVLDGKSAQNPVKDVPPWKETPKPLNLPTIAQAKKAIGKLQQGSKSKARLQVLLWTGWPPAQLMRLTERDIDWPGRRAHVPGRRKGSGVPSKWLPVLPQAVAALKQFHRLDAYGAFSTHTLRHRLHDACRRAKVPIFNPYALRHLFLTTVALATRDDRVVAELAMHADLRMTRRYTEQSVNPRLMAGLKAVTRQLQVATSRAKPRVSLGVKRSRMAKMKAVNARQNRKKVGGR